MCKYAIHIHPCLHRGSGTFVLECCTYSPLSAQGIRYIRAGVQYICIPVRTEDQVHTCWSAVHIHPCVHRGSGTYVLVCSTYSPLSAQRIRYICAGVLYIFTPVCTEDQVHTCWSAVHMHPCLHRGSGTYLCAGVLCSGIFIPSVQYPGADM